MGEVNVQEFKHGLGSSEGLKVQASPDSSHSSVSQEHRRNVAPTSDQSDRSSLQRLPVEVIQQIYLFSLNSDLPNTCKELYTRLSTDYIRPQLVDGLFASLSDAPDTQRTSIDKNFDALLGQSWFEHIALTMPRETIRRWIRGDPNSAIRLFKGPWTQARGNLLIRTIELDVYRPKHIFGSPSPLKDGLRDALRASCVPAVLLLGGFDQEEWLEWDATHAIDKEWTYTARESGSPPVDSPTMISRTWQSTPSGDFTRYPTTVVSRTGQAGGAHSPWVAFMQGGFRLDCRFTDVSSGNLLYSMQNIHRDPSLHRFVIQKTLDRWVSYHTMASSKVIRAFLSSNKDLEDIISWLLDAEYAVGGFQPSGAERVQQFYGALLRRRIFPFKVASLRWLTNDDQQRVLRGDWGPFGS